MGDVVRLRDRLAWFRAVVTAHRLLPLADLAPGTMRCCELDGHAIVVCRVSDDVHVLDDGCTHDDVSLSLGALENCRPRCPLHDSEFDVRTGHLLDEPADENLVRHNAGVEEGIVTVRMSGRVPGL